MTTGIFAAEINRCLIERDPKIQDSMRNASITMKDLEPILHRLIKHEEMAELELIFDGPMPDPQTFFEKRASLTRQLESPHSTELIRKSIIQQLEAMKPFEPSMQKAFDEMRAMGLVK